MSKASIKKVAKAVEEKFNVGGLAEICTSDNYNHLDANKVFFEGTIFNHYRYIHPDLLGVKSGVRAVKDLEGAPREGFEVYDQYVAHAMKSKKDYGINLQFIFG